MPNSADPHSEIHVLREKVAQLEQENVELRAAKRLFEQMAIIDGARLRKLERELRDAGGIASRARGELHKCRAGEVG